jgi:lysozyme
VVVPTVAVPAAAADQIESEVPTRRATTQPLARQTLDAAFVGATPARVTSAPEAPSARSLPAALATVEQAERMLPTDSAGAAALAKQAEAAVRRLLVLRQVSTEEGRPALMRAFQVQRQAEIEQGLRAASEAFASNPSQGTQLANAVAEKIRTYQRQNVLPSSVASSLLARADSIARGQPEPAPATSATEPLSGEAAQVPVSPPTTPRSESDARMARIEELLRQIRERHAAEQPAPIPQVQLPPETGFEGTRPASDAASRGPHTLNQAGLDLIKSFEGLRLNAYRDAVGVWTIGYGHTAGVRAGQAITAAQAEDYLRSDVRRFENAVNAAVKVPLNDNQFAALVSFTYNLGEGALQRSTLLRLLNSGDYAGAAREFDKWVNAGGQRLAGLVRRRDAEQALFVA